MKYEKTYLVRGGADEILAMDFLFARINHLAMVGSSRDITISIDGDGSAKLSIRDADTDQEIDFGEELTKQLRENEAKETTQLGGIVESEGGQKSTYHLADVDKDGNMKIWIGE